MIRWGREEADLREVVTPEGVPLRFRLATLGERLTAFLVDVVVMFAILVAIVLVLVMTLGGGGYLTSAMLLVMFLVRSSYFTGCEYLMGGTTPGKRMVRLRVIDRRGGALEPAAIFGRNLTRELEFFLPVALMVKPQALYPGASGWLAWVSVGWCFVFLLIPLSNRDRLRVGDLVGGTMVVRAPRAALLEDVADALQVAFTFTAAQLSHYGNYELQVLEGLLRKSDQVDLDSMEIVTAKICRRIDHPRVPEGRLLAFLRDFYAAQRAALEREMLFGKRTADKAAAREGR